MYSSILSVLRCPHCGAEFELEAAKTEGEEITEGKITCKNGHGFSVRNGVLDFNSQEQKDLNSWSEYYKDESYERLDREADLQQTENQRKIRKDFFDGIIEEAKKLEEGYLLDIATGRGLLLRELLKKTDTNVHVISADLSFQVLKYDRVKLREINPQVKVSYIACDAAKLPVASESIDTVCTFVGFSNMMDLMEDGIREAARVLKNGAPLINSAVYMDKDADGAKKAAAYLAEIGMAGAEKIYIRDELTAIHKKYFDNVREKIIYEGIAEKAEGDLIPCEGEWFANAVIVAEKNQ